MDFKEILRQRIHAGDVKLLCVECSGRENDRNKELLYSLIKDADERTAYNSLWVFTHFAASDKKWLLTYRNELTDLLLSVDHIGKKRLLLNLLESLPISKEDVRTDYLDFCLSRINSNEPYAIRAFCMKQAYTMCRLYPDLLAELKSELEILGMSDLPPGLKSARQKIIVSP